MRIDVYDHVEGARAARGTAVIIDVFRAFAVAPHLVDCGAVRVLPAGEVDDAIALGRRYPDVLLVGERHARRLPGFEAGNSPTEVRAARVAGRVAVHTTHAGTQGLVNATGADEVLTGSFVNISAVHRHIVARNPAQVSIVRMGQEARERCAEDDLYAECLRLMLEGGAPPTADGVRARLRDAPAALKFFDPACDWAPRTDFDYCTEVNRFDFVLRLRRAAGEPIELERLNPGEG